MSAQESLKDRVAAALAGVRVPRLDADVVSAGLVTELEAGADGGVSFTFVLSREDPATLVREARKAAQSVPGVSDVRVTVRDAAGAAKPQHAPQSAAAAVPPAPKPVAMPALGKVIAVSSGKGGVGKSTVAVNLAAALAKKGLRVGLMDADVYGPNVPRMFGLSSAPPMAEGKIIPLEAHGVKLMSLGFIIDRGKAAIWRGPIIMKIIQQFLRDVAWGELDYLLVDLPPGTGDAQLSLAQSVHIHSGIIVTTPQEVSVGDALRGAKMLETVGVPLLGIVENMSYFECPHCHGRSDVFLSGGGARLAAELGVPLLAAIPLQAGGADLADQGRPLVLAAPDSPAGRALQQMADAVEARAGAVAAPSPTRQPAGAR